MLRTSRNRSRRFIPFYFQFAAVFAHFWFEPMIAIHPGKTKKTIQTIWIKPDQHCFMSKTHFNEQETRTKHRRGMECIASRLGGGE